jgi:CheY-like chemotaxis protein
LPPACYVSPRMAKILVVDDDSAGSEPLCSFLTKAGHDVSCLPNGRKALAAIIDDPPDVVVLDLFMPEMDGGSLLEVLRSYLRLQSMPVIVWTGLPDSPMVERARHLKVNAILVKGKVTLDELRQAIEQELHRLPT